MFESTLEIRLRSAGLVALKIGSVWDVRPDFTAAAIPIMMTETAEELGKRPEIRKELARATGRKIGRAHV